MMDIHLDKMCRVCLKEGENFTSIFYNDEVPGDQVSVSNKIMACSSVQVVAGDGLPELICHDCLNQVGVAYEFKEKCQSADAALRKYISLVGPFYTEQIHVKDEETQTSLDITNFEFVDEITNAPREIKISQETTESDSDVPLSVLQKKEKDKPGETKKRSRGTKKSNDEEISDVDKKKKVKDEKDVKCPVCKKTFAYLCILKDHMVQHTGAKPYLCSACGKSFGHTASLTNHMKTHFSDKPHKCDRCQLGFHRRAHLILHMRTHTGEKPFVCDVCGREFAQNSYLKEHMRVHSGEKPFVCDICGHGFARKSCLVMHRRVHTGELPYPCPECGRAFSQRSQRKRHVKRNHKGSACLRATGELILKDLDLKIKKSNEGEIPKENSVNETVHETVTQTMETMTQTMNETVNTVNTVNNTVNEAVSENSLTEHALTITQDPRLMQQYQQPFQLNNPPLIIYQQDNISNPYPSTVMPLPLIQIQTAFLQ